MRFRYLRFTWNVFLVLLLCPLITGVLLRTLIYLDVLPPPGSSIEPW